MTRSPNNEESSRSSDIYALKANTTLLYNVLLNKKHGIVLLHSVFFIRTSNFGAEAERSYCFCQFEPEMFLGDVLKLPVIVSQEIYADVTKTSII